MKEIKLTFIIAFLLFAIWGCDFIKNKKNVTKYSDYVEMLFLPNKNFFRGNLMGISKEELLDNEKNIKPYNISKDIVEYEINYPKDSTQYQEYAQYQYNFNELDKLDIITGKIFIQDSILADSVYTDLQKLNNSKYGTFQKDDYGYDFWKFKTVNSFKDSIELNLGIKKLFEEDEYIIVFEIMED